MAQQFAGTEIKKPKLMRLETHKSRQELERAWAQAERTEAS